MKIAVLHRYPPRQAIGTNASFVAFLEELSKRDHEVFYLTFKDNKDSQLPKIKNLSYVFVPFTFNRGNNLDKLIKTWLWIFLSPLYVINLFRKEKLDLIYCDDSVPLYGFFAKLLLPKSKVIIRLGDLQSGYSLAGKSPWLFELSQKVEVFMWNIVDGLIAISEPFKEYIVDRGIKPSKVKVVEESINLDETINSKKIKVGEIAFMFHGALLSCKGLETLLRSFKIIKSKYPLAKLIIAGGGGEEGSLKRMSDELKLQDIEFTGWYDHEKLKTIMKKADVGIAMRSGNIANNYVVTTCLLENWKFKKPVIAPRLKAISGIISDKKNGLLFTPDSVSDLVEKMEFLITHPQQWSRLAEEGHRTAENFFEYKKIANKMANILEEYAQK